MNPRHGEVWLVDMGMAAKTRPAVVLFADNLNAPRSLIIYIPVTNQNRGSDLEVALGHLPFLDKESVANVQRRRLSTLCPIRKTPWQIASGRVASN